MPEFILRTCLFVIALCSAAQGELRLGALVEGAPPGLVEGDGLSGYLIGGAAQLRWRFGPIFEFGLEVGWSHQENLDDTRDPNDLQGLSVLRVPLQLSWGLSLGVTRLDLTLEAGHVRVSRETPGPDEEKAGLTVGFLVGLTLPLSGNLELLTQLGMRGLVYVKDYYDAGTEGGQPAGQGVVPFRAGLLYRF